MLGAVFLKSWKMEYITPTLGGLTKTYSPPDLFLVVARQEGLTQPDQLTDWLTNTVTEYEAFIVAARADREE